MWHLHTANAFINYFTKSNFAKSALRDFATAWKVWLFTSTEKLSDNKQGDVVDPADTDKYCLGGSDTSDAKKRVLAVLAVWVGQPDLAVPIPVLACTGASIK